LFAALQEKMQGAPGEDATPTAGQDIGPAHQIPHPVEDSAGAPGT
jgi:hypothetical protein